MSFIDKDGVARHYMTSEELTSLYRQLEELSANITQEEYQEYKQAIQSVETLIHQLTTNNNENKRTTA